MLVLFHEIGEALLQCRRQGGSRRFRCRRIRLRRQQFAKELKCGAEQLTACSGEFFAAGSAFGGGELGLAAQAFIKRRLGAGAKQHFKTAAEFFDAASEIHLIYIALRVQGGKG